MDKLTEITSILSLVGLPTLTGLFLVIYKSVKRSINDITILHKAQKAQMRSQLIEQYDKYMAQYHRNGFVEIIYIDDWISQYKGYHALCGENGILDARYDEIIKIPTSPVARNNRASNN